jgi:glycosyltransferase involved in cell wall biosynthesis
VARVSVLMPTYAQAAFLPRAVASLLAQDLGDWELVVVDDGAPDDVATALAPFADDPRITAHRLPANRGLGAALNEGLKRSGGPLVAYLPSDDVLHADHLSALAGALEDPSVVLARSRCRPAAPSLQLVQVMHRRTADRWTERAKLESDDLELLFFDRLRARGREARIERVTCEWTQHPAQRHRAIASRCDGGLNVFRSRYRVREPLRFHSSDGGRVDEVARYARFRSAGRAPRDPDGLRILLAGELAFNPERVLAFEERGHELLGLWIDDPLGFNTVGPLPFGHVRDLDSVVDIEAARPDVVYALLNWRMVPLAHAILEARTGTPLVFHYKEAPQRSIARGEWPLLAEVVTRADAVVLSSREMRAWFEASLPGRLDPARTLVLDGDLPKRDWLDAEPSPRLSGRDGQIHTVLAGRPYGFDGGLRDGLHARGVRLHVHAGPSAVGPEDWVRVLSRYDAGWLHPVRARNRGDARLAAWDDLNLPGRIPMLLAAGLPLILPRNACGELHAAQAFAESVGAAILYEDLDDLAAQLRDAAVLERRRAAAWAAREEVTFDRHADRLVALLRSVARR